MGKSPKPLQIWVHPTLMDNNQAVFRALSDQGHLIVVDRDIADYAIEDFDLMLGPSCWRMTDDLLKHLDLAIKGARALRYPGKSKSKPSV